MIALAHLLQLNILQLGYECAGCANAKQKCEEFKLKSLVIQKMEVPDVIDSLSNPIYEITANDFMYLKSTNLKDYRKYSAKDGAGR